jgi:8-oxo-dGTP diphosphatase
MDTKLPIIGVGVIVQRNGLVLLGQRAGAHGSGTWALPGGHLEFGESIEECARREVLEETGIELRGINYGPYTNDIFHKEKKHYVTLFVLAQNFNGEPTVREPTKCAQWCWFPWSELPEPLFRPLQALLHSGYIPDGAELISTEGKSDES